MKYYALYRVGSSKHPTQTSDSNGNPWLTYQAALDYLAASGVVFGHSEVREWRDIPSVLHVTSAPVEYDGFGTREMEVLGRSTRGNTVYRLIDVQDENLGWQIGRNASGMHPTMTVDEWDKDKESFLR